MINALHLIWIIPLCIIIGGLGMAFFAGASLPNAEYESYQLGLRDGYELARKKIGVENND